MAAAVGAGLSEAGVDAIGFVGGGVLAGMPRFRRRWMNCSRRAKARQEVLRMSSLIATRAASSIC